MTVVANTRLNPRLLGALGALALTGGALGVVAPASAATGTLAYTCTVPVSGAKPFTAVADTDAPGKIAYGETVTPTATGTITFPEDVTTTLRDTVGAKKVDGKADVAATVDGVATPWTLAVPQTNVPPNGSLVLTGTGPAGTFTGTKVGTVFDIAVGNFTATINNYQANGTPTTTLPTAVVPCVLNPGQNAAVDTIKVVKDVTTTTVKAPDISKGEQARAKVKVVSDHGQTAKGKIKAKLVRNGKVMVTKLVSLQEGKRKVKFVSHTKTGNYSVKVKYVGNENFKGSSSKDAFTVG
jgi:hypothetical protein